MRSFLRLVTSITLALSFTACLSDETTERDSSLEDDEVVCIELYPECGPGEAPADTDGDGCPLECAPVACPAIAVECPGGADPIDADNDGCALECPGVVCPAVEVDCPDGQVPMDLDNDGCALECGEFCGNNP